VLAHHGRPPDAPTIETIVLVTFYEIIKFGIPLADDFILLYPISLVKGGISSSPCAESLGKNWVETSFNPWLGPAP